MNEWEKLARAASLPGKEEEKQAAQKIIREKAEKAGVNVASVKKLYEARGRGEFSGFSVPACNIRGMTYFTARAAYRAAQRGKAGVLVFEIARSEMDYTFQNPAEYASQIIAAAAAEKFPGPVCLQGDHYQVRPRLFRENREGEIGSLKKLISESLEAGFYNIDIDASTVVDLKQPTILAQQENNCQITAELTAFIRGKESKGKEVSVGGEIGEVGAQNSTEEDLRAFMEGYSRELKKFGPKLEGISKISIQTGTTHGGVPLADGSVAKVALDFETLKKLSALARSEFGMAGAVQHGASTLPEEAFHHFPEVECAEVHLATGFQNLLLDSPNFPRELREEMYRYLEQKCADEKKPGMTEEQFIYKTRKKVYGPFKQALWDLPEKVRGKVEEELEARFTLLFDRLRVQNTLDLANKYIR